MIQSDKKDMMTVLDLAIAEVAEKELRRLRRRLSDDDVSLKIGEAFEELDKLQSRIATPDYQNDWVSLFYLTWYQPRQINLIYSYLDQTMTRLPSRLNVFDFGCGAWAVQVALAIFAATHSQTKSKIAVHGIDPSPAMIGIGEQLWQELGKLVRQDRKLITLRQVMKTMSKECRTFTPRADNFPLYSDVDEAFSDRERWVTSIHAVYGQMHPKLGKELKKARSRVQPTRIIVTCDDSKRELLDEALDAVGCTFRTDDVRKVKFKGTLPNTSEWRKTVRQQQMKSLSDQSRNYLKGNVKWWDIKWSPCVRIWDDSGNGDLFL